jgi:hypothetical protein
MSLVPACQAELTEVKALLAGRQSRPGGLDDSASARIAASLQRPDPETFFSRYIYGIQRHAERLLTTAQRAAWSDIIAQRGPLQLRWHDERNVLRCRFQARLWEYAAAEDEAAAAVRAELEAWMELRMRWTFEEQLAAHAFDREVWKLLDAVQQQQLRQGQWKAYVKLDTGHSRGNGLDKSIRRALGEPAFPQRLEEWLEAWEQQREPLHQRLQQAEHRARRVGFAMDLNDPAIIAAMTRTANQAYAALYLAEGDALRRIVRGSYRDFEGRCEAAAAAAWQEAHQRFTGGAAELIRVVESLGTVGQTQPSDPCLGDRRGRGTRD